MLTVKFQGPKLSDSSRLFTQMLSPSLKISVAWQWYFFVSCEPEVVNQNAKDRMVS